MKATETGKYAEKWQIRFNFFAQHGAPKTQEFRIALKKEKFFRRILINMNYYAFFFGCIYFFIIGVWRKNLSLIALTVAIGVIQIIVEKIIGMSLPNAVELPINILIAMMWGTTANYAYYLKEMKGGKSWNPFEGIL
ncbi:DUF2628 domain-containing protein [Brenneria populi]|uniref:DUF2628 domain-containing protein n=1 Tax=Brenneria populi TaxID=1505588 RepID=A0ABU6JUP3_9GAMM|nr:DUF2628 domain-containing protein [Brenneria populi Li et al. 2015]